MRDLGLSLGDHKLHLPEATLLQWSHPGVNAADQVGDLLWGWRVLSLVTSVFLQQVCPGVLDLTLEVKRWWYPEEMPPTGHRPVGKCSSR